MLFLFFLFLLFFFSGIWEGFIFFVLTRVEVRDWTQVLPLKSEAQGDHRAVYLYFLFWLLRCFPPSFSHWESGGREHWRGCDGSQTEMLRRTAAGP